MDLPFRLALCASLIPSHGRGTFGYGLEFAHLVDLNRLGGLVTKGISREPIEGAPAPRLCETPSGMLNAVGLQNVGCGLSEDKLPLLRKYNTSRDRQRLRILPGGVCRGDPRLEEAEGISRLRAEYFLSQRKKRGYAVRQTNPDLVKKW